MSAQVDEHSVSRHRGERRVKTVEEDLEEVSSTTAELLNDEGEELIGSLTTDEIYEIYCASDREVQAFNVDFCRR